MFLCEKDGLKMSLQSHNAAYLAGLIDGEGSIFVQRIRTRNVKASRTGFYYRGGLAVCMTDRKMVQWCKRITGCGAISSPKRCKANHRPGHRWSVWSQQASALLLLLLPYMRLKKPNAVNFIKFQSQMRLHGTPGNSEAEIARRERHRLTSLKLNKRGR